MLCSSQRMRVSRSPLRALRKPDTRHLEHHLLGCDRLGAEQLAQLAAGLAARCDAAGTHLVPVALRLERDRGRNAEVRRRVARALMLRP